MWLLVGVVDSANREHCHGRRVPSDGAALEKEAFAPELTGEGKVFITIRVCLCYGLE